MFASCSLVNCLANMKNIEGNEISDVVQLLLALTVVENCEL